MAPMNTVSTGEAVPAPSAWLRRWAHLLTPGGRVLDVACGSGRNLRWLAAQGLAVTGVDRDAAAVAPLEGIGRIVVADIEGSPWPFAGERFDAVVVFNYLWRPLLPEMLGSIASGGVLIYETFASGQESIGKPSNPDFLLQAGELLHVARDLRVVAYEDGYEDAAEGIRPSATARFVQRIAAVRPPPTATAPLRHRLGASEPADAR
jgi:SAM-dependent methyltransferase